MSTEEELEQECLRRINRARKQDLETISALKKENERLQADNAAYEWAFRGIISAKVSVKFSIEAVLKANEISYGFKILAEQGAHELMALSKRDFRQHARIYEMKNYITYLQNHASNNGLEFTQLGENNDGVSNIFKDDWSPYSYHLSDIKNYLKGV